MGQGLHRGLLQGLDPVEVAGLWVQRLVSTVSWRRLGGLRKVTEGGLVRRSCVFSNLNIEWNLSVYQTTILILKYSVFISAIYRGSQKNVYTFQAIIILLYIQQLLSSVPFMAVAIWELFGIWGCLVVVFAALLCLCVCNERNSHRATGSVRKGLDILPHSFHLSSKLR